jgi:PAS domain S-box-containing protein
MNSTLEPGPLWPDLLLAQAGARRARWLALLAAALCVLALSGWLAGFDLLTRLAPGMPSMKVNTALSFVLISVSVWRCASGPSRLPLIGAPLAVLLALFTGLQWVTESDSWHLDNWLLRDLQTPAAEHPGRMALATSLGVILLGTGLLLLRHGPVAVRRWRLVPTLMALALAYIASVGLMVGVTWTGWLAVIFGSVSLPTATVMLLLGTALMGLEEHAVTSTVAQPRLGRRGIDLIRIALPAALLVPVVIGWPFELLQRQARMTADEAHTMASTLMGLGFGLLAMAAGWWVSRLELSLRANEASLQFRVDQQTEQLRAAKRHADQSRLRLEQIVHAADVGVVAVDEALRICLFNRAAEQMFGLSSAQMMGQTLDRLLPAEHRGQHDAWMRQFGTAQAQHRRMGGRQVRAMRADGSSFPAEATISRVVVDDAMLLTVVLHDLTDSLAVESERAARQAAEAVNQARVTQLGHISHELRNPLNAVIGLADLLLAGKTAAAPAERQKWLGMIKDAGLHMLRLISDLMDMTRVESQLDPIRRVPVNARTVVSSVVDLLQTTAAAVEVALVLEAPSGEALWVLADEHRLRQVVLNLVGNAIKYNQRPGRVRLRIGSAIDGEVSIEVEDTGLGMTAQQLKHLFEPFNRLGREATDIEGTGLGLALSRTLAIAMGGRIEVQSQDGQGSCFTVTLTSSPAP